VHGRLRREATRVVCRERLHRGDPGVELGDVVRGDRVRRGARPERQGRGVGEGEVHRQRVRGRRAARQHVGTRRKVCRAAGRDVGRGDGVGAGAARGHQGGGGTGTERAEAQEDVAAVVLWGVMLGAFASWRCARDALDGDAARPKAGARSRRG